MSHQFEVTEPPISTAEVFRQYRERMGLMTPEELSRTLEVTAATLKVWRSKGRGPKYIRLGKGVFYRMSDVETWIDNTWSEP